MTSDEKSLGTVLLSFLTGAALGVGLIVLYAKTTGNNSDADNEDGPLFI